MGVSASSDGADKGTDQYEGCTGGTMGTGKDPYVGKGPGGMKDVEAVTGGEGDKTGGGKGMKGESSY